MEDVQARGDDRGIAIERAGVRDLRYPIAVLDRREGKQQTVGVVDCVRVGALPRKRART